MRLSSHRHTMHGMQAPAFTHMNTYKHTSERERKRGEEQKSGLERWLHS